MKKYPRVVQCDSRGQIVIPKNIRKELMIEEGAAFWMIQTEEGIFLKQIETINEKTVEKAIRGIKK